MSYTPIERIVPQYVDLNGKPYSGAVLKAYAAGTNTTIPFSIDSDGNTLSATITLNASGYPVVSGTVVIPYLDRAYKIALYPNQTSADSDTNWIWMIPNLNLISEFNNIDNGTLRNNPVNVGQIQDGQFRYLGLTAGLDNGYTIFPSPAVSAYTTTMQFFAKIHQTNTASPAAYLQLSSIDNPATNALIKKLDVSKNEIALEAGDMVANGIYQFQRNSNNNAWILLNPEKPLLNAPSIALADNIVKATTSIYGVSYLAKPVRIELNGSDEVRFYPGVVDFDDGTGQVILTLPEGSSNQYISKYLNLVSGASRFLFKSTGIGVANTIYHCFVIYNPTTKEVRCGGSIFLNPLDSGVDMPAGFTKFKRIASIRTEPAINAIMGGNFLFNKDGSHYFTYNNHVQDFTASNSSGAIQNLTLTVPDVPVLAKIKLGSNQNTVNAYASITAYEKGSSSAMLYTGNADTGGQSATGYIPITLAGDRRISISYGMSAAGSVSVHTLGWYDPCNYYKPPNPY